MFPLQGSVGSKLINNTQQQINNQSLLIITKPFTSNKIIKAIKEKIAVLPVSSIYEIDTDSIQNIHVKYISTVRNLCIEQETWKSEINYQQLQSNT